MLKDEILLKIEKPARYLGEREGKDRHPGCHVLPGCL